MERRGEDLKIKKGRRFLLGRESFWEERVKAGREKRDWTEKDGKEEDTEFLRGGKIHLFGEREEEGWQSSETFISKYGLLGDFNKFI